MDQRAVKEAIARNWRMKISPVEVDNALYGWAMGELSDAELLSRLRRTLRDAALLLTPEERVAAEQTDEARKSA